MRSDRRLDWRDKAFIEYCLSRIVISFGWEQYSTGREAL
jgi:hypothetical protein